MNILCQCEKSNSNPLENKVLTGKWRYLVGIPSGASVKVLYNRSRIETQTMFSQWQLAMNMKPFFLAPNGSRSQADTRGLYKSTCFLRSTISAFTISVWRRTVFTFSFSHGTASGLTTVGKGPQDLRLFSPKTSGNFCQPTFVGLKVGTFLSFFFFPKLRLAYNWISATISVMPNVVMDL